MNSIRYLVVLGFMICIGCSAVQFNPVTNESRAVTATSDQNKTIQFKESMVWYDKATNPTKGILFPDGMYTLEAEDTDYLYFRAPRQFDYRFFTNGEETDRKLINGGLYLSKTFLTAVPAGAYISIDDTNKTLTWKLGGDFLLMEGEKWERNL